MSTFTPKRSVMLSPHLQPILRSETGTLTISHDTVVNMSYGEITLFPYQGIFLKGVKVKSFYDRFSGGTTFTWRHDD